MSQQRWAIKDVLADSVRGWNRGDLDRFMTAYEHGPETVYITGNELVKGHVEIHARYARIFATANSDARGELKFDVLDIKLLGRGYALLTGRYELIREGKVAVSVCTLVFHRTLLGWRIVSDHS